MWIYKIIFVIFLWDQLCYTSGLQCHWQGVCTESKLIGYIDFVENNMDVSEGKTRCDVKCRDSLAFGLNCTHNVWDHRAHRCLLYEGNQQQHPSSFKNFNKNIFLTLLSS